jgi:copper chaperone NosL
MPLIMIAACRTGWEPPAPLDTASESCRSCRMAVSQVRFAAQIVAPGEEPAFFDDVGCLGAYLASPGPLGRGAIAYVADHRTGEWVPAADAVYTRVADLQTPMGSHLIAHADSASREADAAARGGVIADPKEIFGASGPPGGEQ